MHIYISFRVYIEKDTEKEARYSRIYHLTNAHLLGPFIDSLDSVGRPKGCQRWKPECCNMFMHDDAEP